MKLSPVLLLLLVFAHLLGGCGRTASSAKPGDVAYYTCAMHPSVKSQDPKAKCPICSMDLSPVKKQGDIVTESGSPPSAHDHGMPGHADQPAAPASSPSPANTAPTPGDEKPHEFTVPLDRQQLIGVTYAAVEKTPLKTVIRAAGTVAPDKLRHWDYVSRVEGYVQKLFVGSRGETVRRGAPLLTLFSPDLLAAQREFVEALRIRDEAHHSPAMPGAESADRLVTAARRRLAIWNLGEDYLAELERTRQPSDTLTLSSPFDGIVLELRADQGSRVMPGDHLVDVANLSVVWVWAEFYQEELSLAAVGKSVTITASAYPNERLAGRIALVDPFLDPVKRTGRVRIDVENSEMKLRPDMFVNVELALEFGEGLTVPVGAVLPTGEKNIVFVDKGSGRLEPRFIELGRKFGDRYVVANGLAEGDRVVSSGNFLIDAEAKVQGALKSW